MRTLARDIQLTLLIKFLLLFIVWFLCFRATDKPIVNPQQWLVASPDTTQPALTPSIDVHSLKGAL